MGQGMYAKYLQERENVHLLEYAHGFSIYKILPDCIYLQDIYVLPEFRKCGHGVTMMDDVTTIGREMGKTKLLGSVVPSTKFGPQMLQIMLQLGFKLHSAENDIVYLIKDIGV